MKYHFSTRLRLLRCRKGLTQSEVARSLSLTVQAVSKWETGRNLPDIALLPEIADLYGVTIDELFRTKTEEGLSHDDADRPDQ
ncbi:MAG: helix-turn-helix transcriptional regulator [Clostridia bacterium]|nr:helix-turn-helix transcriptional regulator [Clostridia bacterium]